MAENIHKSIPKQPPNDKPKKEVQAHETIREFIEVIDVPEHVQRKGESSLFHKNVKKLKQDGFYKCFVDGSTDDCQVHHLICEWSLEPDVDFLKLKRMCEIFDPYGYGEKMKDIPITSVDDIRNMLVLSRKFHEEQVTGIHNTTFSAWVSQLIVKDGVESVPEDRNTIEKIEEEIKEKDRK